MLLLFLLSCGHSNRPQSRVQVLSVRLPIFVRNLFPSSCSRTKISRAVLLKWNFAVCNFSVSNSQELYCTQIKLKTLDAGHLTFSRDCGLLFFIVLHFIVGLVSSAVSHPCLTLSLSLSSVCPVQCPNLKNKKIRKKQVCVNVRWLASSFLNLICVQQSLWVGYW